MIQVVFQPSLNIQHTTFRLLRLRLALSFESGIEQEKLRIMDFFSAFPAQLSSVRLSPETRWIRGVAKQYDAVQSYADFPNGRTVFERMGVFQNSAIRYLVELGVILRGTQRKDTLYPGTLESVPSQLVDLARQRNGEDESLMKALQTANDYFGLFGRNGLKDRTGLMSFEHDSI